MDWSTIAGLALRHLLTLAAGWLISKGWLGTGMEANFVDIAFGIIAGAAGFGWSVWTKYGKVLVDARLARKHGLAPPVESPIPGM